MLMRRWAEVRIDSDLEYELCALTFGMDLSYAFFHQVLYPLLFQLGS